MKGFFRVVRWIIAVLLSLLFIFYVALAIPVSSLTATISNRDNIKSWLKDSTLYDNALSIAADIMSDMPEEEHEGTNDEGPEGSFFTEMATRLQDPEDELTKLVEEIITPQYLEETVNTVIDALYDWLEGESETIVFSISLIEDEDDFIELMSVGFKEKARELPTCDSSFIMSPDFIPLETECWPEGLDLDEISSFISDNADSAEFEDMFSMAQFSSEDMIDIEPEVTKQVQLFFRIARFAPVIILFVGLLLLGLILLVVPGGKASLFTGSVVMFIPTISWTLVILFKIFTPTRIFGFTPEEMSSPQFDTVKPYLKLILQEFLDDFSRSGLISSMMLLIIPILLIVISILVNKKAKVEESPVSEEVSVEGKVNNAEVKGVKKKE